MLIPAPGFSLYETICNYKSFEAKHYRLLPERNWEVDLEDLERQIDSLTCAILINNPSNPCGTVYSKQHLQQILKIASKHKIPIIADEIYDKLIFPGNEFFSLGSLSIDVPVLSIGGMAKVFVVPGWRIGWITIHDRNNVLSELRPGLVKLSQIILGANSVAQSVIPDAILHTPQSFFPDLCQKLNENAQLLYRSIQSIPGLFAVEPKGAMYIMMGIRVNEFKDIKNDVEFALKLLEEENVFVLPGKIFKCENFVRLVICPPPNLLSEASQRIKEFCQRHHK